LPFAVTLQRHREGRRPAAIQGRIINWIASLRSQ
jgi:hypothetical protein